MTSSLLQPAFAHHVWATQRLLGACAALSSEQLETTAIGTFGPIIETLRHTVGADAAYLVALTDGEAPVVDESEMDLAELIEVMDRNGPAWAALLDKEPDPDLDVIRYREDGSEGHAPIGIRLAQVLHHGTDHRSQVCTALTTLGIEPPLIDVWDFGEAKGTVFELQGPS